MLCFRCEHRAQFLEGKGQPRCECGDIERAVSSCYMFLPVRPLRTERTDKTDLRPEHGGYFGCRMKAVEVMEDWMVDLTKDGVLYWKPPKRNKKRSTK